jgi:hypothetical protein
MESTKGTLLVEIWYVNAVLERSNLMGVAWFVKEKKRQFIIWICVLYAIEVAVYSVA